jgi:ribosomal protein L40E
MRRSVPSVHVVSQREIKICTMCGALNHIYNRECHNCSWTGRFDDEADEVSAVLEEVKQQLGLVTANDVVCTTTVGREVHGLWCLMVAALTRILRRPAKPSDLVQPGADRTAH